VNSAKGKVGTGAAFPSAVTINNGYKRGLALENIKGDMQRFFTKLMKSSF